MNTLEKLNSPPLPAILRDFQNQEYRFTIPKSWTRLAKKTRSRKKRRRRQAIAMRYAFHAIPKMLQQPLGTLQIIAPGKTKNSLKNILENILGFH